jgi:hypothetical protein
MPWVWRTSGPVRRLTDALENRGYIIARRRKQASMLYRLAQDRTELSYQGQVQNQTEDEARPDISDRSSAQDRTIFAPRPVNSVPQDRTELSAKPLNEPMKNQGRAHATLIPDDFELSEETHNWAIDRLGSNEAVARSVERFINHFRQVEGRTAKSRDWDAKVRNWIDEDARKTALHKKQISSERPSAITDDHWRAVLKTYVGTKHWTQHATLFGPEPSSPNCRAPAHLLLEYGIRREAVAWPAAMQGTQSSAGDAAPSASGGVAPVLEVASPSVARLNASIFRFDAVDAIVAASWLGPKRDLNRPFGISLRQNVCVMNHLRQFTWRSLTHCMEGKGSNIDSVPQSLGDLNAPFSDLAGVVSHWVMRTPKASWGGVGFQMAEQARSAVLEQTPGLNTQPFGYTNSSLPERPARRLRRIGIFRVPEE